MDTWLSIEKLDSFILNRKDIQGDQEGFIICCIKYNVNDNKVCLFKPAPTVKDNILNYMKDGGPKGERSAENNKHDDMADVTSKWHKLLYYITKFSVF